MEKVTRLIAFAFLMGMAMTAWAAVPAPPVNQNLGIPDTVFNLLTADVCRTCHNQNPPPGIPVNPTYLPDRHHASVGMPIDGVPEFPPNRDVDGDGVNDTTFGCLNCHSLIVDPNTTQAELDPSFRDCLTCHVVRGVDASVHHKTVWAKNGDCARCHGSLVASVDQGQAAPTYSPSLVTPYPSGKPNGDTSMVSSAGTNPGNCNYCHNSANGLENGTPNVPSPFGNITVFTNKQNHHGTGLPNVTPIPIAQGGLTDDVQTCTWCHDVSVPPTQVAIRVCQRCHDRATLHNIQYDSTPQTILQPGAEDPYFGHIGSNDDCWGCHGNNGVSMLSTGPIAVATVPALSAMSVSSIKAGVQVNLTLTGNGFVNSSNLTGQTYDSDVQLTDANGVKTVLEPITVNPDFIEVTLPADLAPGNYRVNVKKGGMLSNPQILTVTEPVNLRAGYCYGRYSLAILQGTGLSQFLDAVDSGTSISNAADGTKAQRVYRWAGGMIAAQFAGGCPDAVNVETVTDSATQALTRF